MTKKKTEESVNLLTIGVDEIIVKPELQVRKGLNARTVEEYTEMTREHGIFPTLRVGQLMDDYDKPPKLYLIDGFHRLAAFKAAGCETAAVYVDYYDSFDEMYEDALAHNLEHGLNLTDEERRDAIQKIIKRHPDESIREIADRCGCTKSTVQRYMAQLSQVGHLDRPEKVKGKDGKEYPTTVARKVAAEPDEEKQTQKDPVHFCAGGCGTPIWEEMKNANDCAYVERDGKWYCSEECASDPTDEDVPEGDEDEVSLECNGSEMAPPPPSDLTVVTCQHCGKTTTLKDALDYQKSGWQPCDVLGDVTNHWCCSEECLAAEMGEPAVKPEKKRRAEAKPEPEPEPEKEAPADPAALHVPKCPFSKFHHPRLAKVSNNGYRVACPECDKEGRIVRTYVDKSWRKAYQAWGRYDNETKTLEELLEKADY